MILSPAAKYRIKSRLWDLPTPVSRALVGLACSAHLLDRSYRAYFQMGRPTEILSGPFRGMAYRPVAAGSAWMPKIMGTYEMELNPYVERACGEACDLVVDVGSAEGYYAIGLARRIPSAVVHAFDTDAKVAGLLMDNARLNGVADRVVPGGFCSPAGLDVLLGGSKMPLVVSDCEGFEAELLDPEVAPGLKRARMIVEIHEYHDTDALRRCLAGRFSATHEIAVARVRPRVRADLPEPYRSDLCDADADAVMDEGRPWRGNWMALWPKS